MSGPLAGVRVVVTRAESQAEALSAGFRDAGAEVATLPLLEVDYEPHKLLLALAVAIPEHWDWFVFTSANAVVALFEALGEPLDGRTRTAAVGPATAAALEAYGTRPDVVARRSDALGLAEELAPHLLPGVQVLVPRAEDARPEIVDALGAAGAKVTPVLAYEKKLPDDAPDRARELFTRGRKNLPLGWVTFTSPRVVEHFVDLFGYGWSRRRKSLLAASIGPVTTAALREAGVEPAAIAASPTAAELVAAVVRAVERGVPKD